MDNSPIFKHGKPSISMGHLYHGYVSHNQRVDALASASFVLWEEYESSMILESTTIVALGEDLDLFSREHLQETLVFTIKYRGLL